MWFVRNIEFRPVEMDFSRSEQGRHPSTTVYADGEQFINALTLVDFAREAVQLCVCGECGSTGCKSGDYVSLRRLGDGIVLVPCFCEMVRKGVDDQYDPPHWLEVKGPAFLTGHALEHLGSRVPTFCELDRWPLLSASEFARIMQMAAPARLLGEFPFPPRVRDELVVVVDPGEKDEVLPVLDNLLARAFASDEPVTLSRGEPVTFYLDGPGIVEWVPLALADGKPLLANGPDWVVTLPHAE